MMPAQDVIDLLAQGGGEETAQNFADKVGGKISSYVESDSRTFWQYIKRNERKKREEADRFSDFSVSLLTGDALTQTNQRLEEINKQIASAINNFGAFTPPEESPIDPFEAGATLLLQLLNPEEAHIAARAPEQLRQMRHGRNVEQSAREHEIEQFRNKLLLDSLMKERGDLSDFSQKLTMEGIRQDYDAPIKAANLEMVRFGKQLNLFDEMNRITDDLSKANPDEIDLHLQRYNDLASVSGGVISPLDEAAVKGIRGEAERRRELEKAKASAAAMNRYFAFLSQIGKTYEQLDPAQQQVLLDLRSATAREFGTNEDLLPHPGIFNRITPATRLRIQNAQTTAQNAQTRIAELYERVRHNKVLETLGAERNLISWGNLAARINDAVTRTSKGDNLDDVTYRQMARELGTLKADAAKFRATDPEFAASLDREVTALETALNELRAARDENLSKGFENSNDPYRLADTLKAQGVPPDEIIRILRGMGLLR